MEDLLQLMISAAQDGGALALKLQKQQLDVQHKPGGTPVTNADFAVNALLYERLMGAEKSFGWLSEESADDLGRRDKSHVWLVDPIDGTRAFMRPDDPHWCIGLALLEHGKPIAAVIHAPAHAETFWASKGKGSFLNGARITSGDHPDIKGCRMIGTKTMFSHPAWPSPWPEMQIADPKPNATLYRMALVAAGRADASLALVRKSDWDLAAGALILNEAGGCATTHIGEEFEFNRQVPAQRSLLCSGKALHPLLIDRVRNVRLPNPHKADAPVKKNASKGPAMSTEPKPSRQLLHIVIGGELKDVTGVEFEDLTKVDFVGAFPDYASAYDAWKGAAHRTVDNAEMRYFILHAHKLLDPETGHHHQV